MPRVFICKLENNNFKFTILINYALIIGSSISEVIAQIRENSHIFLKVDFKYNEKVSWKFDRKIEYQIICKTTMIN
jgi:hypothetical protein